MDKLLSNFFGIQAGPPTGCNSSYYTKEVCDPTYIYCDKQTSKGDYWLYYYNTSTGKMCNKVFDSRNPCCYF